MVSTLPPVPGLRSRRVCRFASSLPANVRWRLGRHVSGCSIGLPRLLRIMCSLRSRGRRPARIMFSATTRVVEAPSSWLEVIASWISESMMNRSRRSGFATGSETPGRPRSRLSIRCRASCTGSGSMKKKGRPPVSRNGSGRNRLLQDSFTPSHLSSWLRPSGGARWRSLSQCRYRPSTVGRKPLSRISGRRWPCPASSASSGFGARGGFMVVPRRVVRRDWPVGWPVMIIHH